ncbi:MAG: twin-arginine translocase subunit TatC [Muribaculaceae bacterium]|nr:twin-arginine translocase subunit TatC [Muribaculaceae bacterium]
MSADKQEMREMSFWEHLDTLRSVILRAAAVILTIGIALFNFMPWIFDNIILAPCHGDFPLYRFIDILTDKMSWIQATQMSENFELQLINIQLASQFFIHMSASCWLALVLSFPIIIYLLWGFIKPGLYASERRGAVKAFIFGNAMFVAGIAVGYFVIFPITVRFLAGYQLSPTIPNTISIDSYMDTFISLILIMGLTFELPLLAWMLGRAGVLHRQFFTRYRRHAIVALLILAAIITPTGDPFTLMLVFAPIYMLWEFSAYLVAPKEI